MVNKAPSKGCDRCRSRHIKCDEGKPHCQKCVVKGLECRYRDANGWVFKDQSAAVVRRQGKRPTALQRHNTFGSGKESRAHPVKNELSLINTSGALQPAQHPSPQDSDGSYQSPYLTADSNRIYKMHDAQLHRYQILYKAMNMPRGASWLFRHGSLSLLPTVDLSTSLVQASIDALCFSEMGKTFNDEQCSHLGAMRLCDALSLLKYEVGHPIPGRKAEGATHRQRLVFASIMLLAFREVSEAVVTRSGEDAWLAHVRGAQQYVRAVGPEIVSSPFDMLLVTDLRASSFAPGITARKSDVWSGAEWVHLCRRQAGGLPSPRRFEPKDDDYSHHHDFDFLLYGDAARVASLLEYGDDVLRDHDVSRASKAFHTLKAMFDRLEAWVEMQNCEGGENLWYDIVPTEQLKAFHTACTSDLFKTVYHFPGTKSIFRCTTLWVGCYVLGDLAINILNMAAEFGKPLDDVDVDMFKMRLYVVATHLARSVPYTFETGLTAVGGLAEYRLGLAEKHFKAYGTEREVEWVNAIRAILPLPVLDRYASITAP